jgi:hypothetical protein
MSYKKVFKPKTFESSDIEFDNQKKRKKMAIQTLNTIKNWFKTNLKPTQSQFWDTWDSFRHKNEKIPVEDVEGIDELLNAFEGKTLDEVLNAGNISYKSASIGGVWINPTPGNNVLLGSANTGQGLPNSNYNTAIGIGAGAFASENYYSSMLGTYSGQSSSGISNTFLGSFSGFRNTGSGVVGIGFNGGGSNTYSNVIILSGINYGNGGAVIPSNDHQFVIGSINEKSIRFNTNVETALDFDFPSQSGKLATTDDIGSPVSAIQIGIVDNTSLQELGGTDKTINGIRIGKGNANYENNLVIGRNGLASVTTGKYNVAIGNGDGDVEGPLQYLTTGNNNTMVGSDAGVNNITGSKNTGIGTASLFNNTSGGNNTAIGAFALNNNLTSPFNVAIGSNALSKMESGLGQSTAIGSYCMSDATGTDKNAAIGTYALRYNTTGFSNAAFGHTALGLNTSGHSNNAVGNYSLGAITTGFANVGVGKFAGRYITTGSSNIYIGSEGAVSDAEANGIINIGNRFIAKGTKVSLVGTLNVGTTPIYENNLTALAGGLIAGDIYRTSTGVLMITF